MDDFAVRMEQQLDLRMEAQHLQNFRNNFRDVPDIHFPVPVDMRSAGLQQKAEPETGGGVQRGGGKGGGDGGGVDGNKYDDDAPASSFAGNEDVLVESFIADGEPILSFIRKSSGATEATKRRLADICLKGIVKMVLVDNLLHGDLHPGNIFVCDRRGKSKQLVTTSTGGASGEAEKGNNNDGGGGGGGDAGGTSANSNSKGPLWLQMASQLAEAAVAEFWERLGFGSSGGSGGSGSSGGSGGSGGEGSGDVQSDLSVVFLDAGLTIRLDQRQHESLVAILRAFTEQDGRRAAQLAVEASRASEKQRQKEKGTEEGGAAVKGESELEETKRIEDFYDGCQDVFLEAKKSGNLTLSLSRHITDMFSLAAAHNVRLESFFVSTALAVRVMEGIAARLTPDVEVSSSVALFAIRCWE